jgi:hypothetical protein
MSTSPRSPGFPSSGSNFLSSSSLTRNERKLLELSFRRTVNAYVNDTGSYVMD